MLNSRLRSLVKELEDGDYKTAAYMAGCCNVSEKTVRVQLKALSIVIKDHGAEIISKKGWGYQLIVNNREKFISLLDKKESLPSIAEDRIDYVMELFLNSDEYLKKDILSEKLYISNKTLTNELKKIEHIFNQYQLKLDRKPYHGIKLIGNEFDKRRCIQDHLVIRSFQKKEKKELDEADIGQFIIDSINEFEVNLSELAFKNLTDYIYVTLGRIKKGFIIKGLEDKAQVNINSKVYGLARTIMNKMVEKFRVRATEEEIFYIAVYIAGKRMIGNSYYKESNFIISENINKLVCEMLNIIYDSFKVDFRDNFNLRMLLNQHMMPFNIRMKYGILLENPLVDVIKKKYFLAYTMAQQACVQLQKYYNNDITDDEICYFACLIELGLEQQKKPIDKKNILLVCVSGKASSQLLLYKLKKEFNEYIDQIYMCNTLDLESFNFDKIDYIFTTVPIHTKVSVPIMEIDDFLAAEKIMAVREKFKLGDLSFLTNYYKKSYFFSNIKGETKEEVLKEMCEKIAKKRKLPAKFYDSILEREKLGSTDYGNLAAIPHPTKIMLDENLVCVGILEKPIHWVRNKVQFIILVSIADSISKDTQKFFEVTTSILLDVETVVEIIEAKRFETLIEKLSSTHRNKSK